jgi:hypothetical protein
MMRIHIDIEQWNRNALLNNKNNNNSNVLIDDNIPMHNWILFCIYFHSVTAATTNEMRISWGDFRSVFIRHTQLFCNNSTMFHNSELKKISNGY